MRPRHSRYFPPVPHLHTRRLTPTQRYEARIDDYHKIKRLNLYKHDGSPLMPLYIAYTTPKMLPTTTLNPLVTATAKAKRGLPLPDHEVLFRKSGNMADNVFWAGLLATGAGGLLWWFF